MNNKKISILDCTLRDGGLALEDTILNGGKTRVFDQSTTQSFIDTMMQSKVEIIELGAIEITSNDQRQFSIYQSIEQVSKLIPVKKPVDQMYVALFRGPDTPIEEIPMWNQNYCQGIRVIIRYSEIDKSLKFCRDLAKKGYKVFVQPMVTMRYTESQLQSLIDECNDFGAHALYLVDSYGYMESRDVMELSQRFDNGLSQNICLGFHSHNNLNLAFSNVITFIEQSSNRPIIIDSTINGMGQGAGNVQTELLLPYLNDKYNRHYNFAAILDACEIIETFWNDNLWGYSVTNLLPAIHKTAYKYSAALRKKFNLSYSQINELLSMMPDELRHRYSIENVEKIISILKDTQ